MMESAPSDESMMPNKPTLAALRECGHWLSTCLIFGWRKGDLDFLEALWWKHHDHRGQLISGPLPPSPDAQEDKK